MNYYQRNIGDYRRDTTHLSLLEHGVYNQLLDTYYLKELPLTADLAELMRTHGARTPDEQEAVRNVLKDFFALSPDGYRHDKCERVLGHIYSKSESARLSAQARWDKERSRKNNGLDANALQSQSESNANPMLPNNPIPNNPIPKKKEPRVRAVKSDDFTLPDWINKEHWDAWHSSAKRRKATVKQKELSVKKLDAWRQAGLDHAKALENAAEGGWQGLFLPAAQRPAPADVARITVPSRTGIDPTLARIVAEERVGKGVPAHIRAEAERIKRGLPKQ